VKEEMGLLFSSVNLGESEGNTISNPILGNLAGVCFILGYFSHTVITHQMEVMSKEKVEKCCMWSLIKYIITPM
jgi:hypothetical protein